MKMSSNTILITGATSGIGLALAERFLKLDNEVIICGRREERFQEIKQKHPAIHVRVCDISKEAERIALFEWAIQNFPKLNVLINNAGIQRRFEMPPQEHWNETAQEIEINLNAPLHLSFLFTPHLEKQSNPVLVMVSSGLAFVPMAGMPVYCATKAAIHSFALSARHVLGKKGIEVIEIIPPAVNTDLGGAGLHTWATPLDEFADAAMNQLEQQKAEVTYGTSSKTSQAARDELQAVFARMNQ